MTITDGAFEVATFKDDESDLIRSVNWMAQLDTNTDMEVIVARAPKADSAPDIQADASIVADIVQVLRDYFSEGRATEERVAQLKDPWSLTTLPSQAAEARAKRTLSSAAEPSTQEPQQKRIRAPAAEIPTTEGNLEKYSTQLLHALKMFVSTRSAFVNIGGVKNKLAEAGTPADKDQVALLAFKFMEELGLAKIGGHRSSLTFFGIPPQHLDNVADVMSRLSGVSADAVKGRLTSRPTLNENFDYDAFRAAAARAGIPQGPAPVGQAPAPGHGAAAANPGMPEGPVADGQA